MTHRDGQSMRRRTKSTHIAESARRVVGGFTTHERDRMTSSGALAGLWLTCRRSQGWFPPWQERAMASWSAGGMGSVMTPNGTFTLDPAGAAPVPPRDRPGPRQQEGGDGPPHPQRLGHRRPARAGPAERSGRGTCPLRPAPRLRPQPLGSAPPARQQSRRRRHRTEHASWWPCKACGRSVPRG